MRQQSRAQSKRICLWYGPIQGLCTKPEHSKHGSILLVVIREQTRQHFNELNHRAKQESQNSRYKEHKYRSVTKPSVANRSAIVVLVQVIY